MSSNNRARGFLVFVISKWDDLQICYNFTGKHCLERHSHQHPAIICIQKVFEPIMTGLVFFQTFSCFSPRSQHWCSIPCLDVPGLGLINELPPWFYLMWKKRACCVPTSARRRLTALISPLPDLRKWGGKHRQASHTRVIGFIYIDCMYFVR